MVACCVMHSFICKNNDCEGHDDDISLNNEELSNLANLDAHNECTNPHATPNVENPQPLPLYTQREREKEG